VFSQNKKQNNLEHKDDDERILQNLFDIAGIQGALPHDKVVDGYTGRSNQVQTQGKI
jgi:hypothetical protein